MEDLRMIDHGNCFVQSNPADWGPKGNMGHWGSYKISNEQFLKEVRQFILNNLDDSVVEKIVESTSKKNPEFWSQEMIELQKLRVRVLKEGVASGKISTPAELAKYCSDNMIQSIFI